MTSQRLLKGPGVRRCTHFSSWMVFVSSITITTWFISRVAHGYGWHRGVWDTGMTGMGAVLEWSNPRDTVYPCRRYTGFHGVEGWWQGQGGPRTSSVILRTTLSHNTYEHFRNWSAAMSCCYPHLLQIKLTITVSRLRLVAISKLEAWSTSGHIAPGRQFSLLSLSFSIVANAVSILNLHGLVPYHCEATCRHHGRWWTMKSWLWLWFFTLYCHGSQNICWPLHYQIYHLPSSFCSIQGFSSSCCQIYCWEFVKSH